MPNKTFIAISSEIQNNKLVLLNTSCGNFLYDENGIDVERGLAFLFNLVYKRNKKQGIVFVTYAASRDNEFLFSTLPDSLKDKLFVSMPVKQEINKLEAENEEIADIYYQAGKDTQDFEQADFEKYVNNLRLKELSEIKYKDYDIKLYNGKILTIRKNGRSISIYDIYGFFKPNSLRNAYKIFCGKDIAILDRTIFNTLPVNLRDGHTASNIECQSISFLAEKVNSELQQIGINLSRFHGASAIASKILSRSKAKDYYHNYRYKRQLSPELYKAVMSAYFGGRAEQFKIGTIKDVKIYDINSAYAYASIFLPTMLNKPYFVGNWRPQPFSAWYCEFDFSNISNLYYGLLPFRELNGNTRYKLKGRGYYWQPEVSYILENFPDCIEVKHGYCLDYELAPFTREIEDLYNLRLYLQKQNNPLEKIIKLALSSIYGKFCQHNGKGRFYNMFYAGFITSFVRRMLLEATKGNEEKTICFQTDAIHTTAILQVPCNNDFGQYKHSQYDKITYVDTGIYCAYKNNEICKTKTQGFHSFDFEKALDEIKDKNIYSAIANLFIGYNIYERGLFNGKAEYLEDYAGEIKTNIIESDISKIMRIFEPLKGIDLRKDFLDSRIVPFYSSRDSAIYKHADYNITDAAIDTLEAKRV